MRVYWTWEDHMALATREGGHQAHVVNSDDKLFFIEVMYNMREHGVDVVITMISNGKSLTAAARQVYNEAQLWLEELCTKCNIVLQLRCESISGPYINYQASPNRYQATLGRKIIQRIARFRVALEAAPPLEAQRRFYGPDSSVALNRAARPSVDNDVFLSAAVTVAAAQAFGLLKAHTLQQDECGTTERREATSDMQGKWTQGNAAQGSRGSMDSVQDAGGATANEATEDEATDDRNELSDDEFLASMVNHRSQLSTILVHGQDDDPAVVPRWFAFTPAVGDAMFRASCEGNPKPCGRKRRCLYCQYLDGRNHYHGYESKAAVAILQERLTTAAGVIVRIDFDRPVIDVALTISHHLRYKDGSRDVFWDKMASKYGAMPVALSCKRTLIASEGLSPYDVTRRRNRVSQEVEYGVYEDLGNWSYSHWMASRLDDTQFSAMIDECGLTMDAWGDQVEAALGMGYLGERVPELTNHFAGDVEGFRCRLEAELTLVKGARQHATALLN